MRGGWSAWAHLVCLAGSVGLIGVCTIGVATRVVDATMLGLVAVYGLLAAGACGCAWMLGRVTRWSWPTRLAAVWCAAFAWFVGPLNVVAVLVLALAALAVGGLCVNGSQRRAKMAVCAGLVVIGCFTGWVVTLPIHFAPAWWVSLIGLACWRWRSVVGVVRMGMLRWRRVQAGSPRLTCIMVLGIGLVSTACWLPNLQADDLAHHLRLPTELVQAGAYAPDARISLWAFAPWLNNTLHGIVAVLGGGVAHGALNGLWLVLIGGLAWRVMAVLGASPGVRAAGVLVVLSIPMVGGLATGMHTELPATALMLALCIAAFDRRGTCGLVVVAVLGAGLLALKLMHVAAALPLLGFAMLRQARRASWREVIVATVLLLSGMSAYAHAALATGNPVLPLVNGVFRSDFAPLANFSDARWAEGWSLTLPFRLVFDTTRYLESGRGALGVVLVAFAAVLTIGIADRRARTPVLLALAAVVIPYCVVPYARYLLPGLACLSVVGLATAERLLGRGETLRLGLACVALHAVLLPSGNWLLSTSALARHVAAMGRPDATTHRFLPERGVLETLPPAPGVVIATHPRAPWTAWLGRHGVGVGWYAPTFERAATDGDADPTGDAWRGLFADVDARWALVDGRHASPALRAALAAEGAILHARIRHAEVWRLSNRVE